MRERISLVLAVDSKSNGFSNFSGTVYIFVKGKSSFIHVISCCRLRDEELLLEMQKQAEKRKKCMKRSLQDTKKTVSHLLCWN